MSHVKTFSLLIILIFNTILLTGCSNHNHDEVAGEVFESDHIYLTHMGLVRGHLHVGIELGICHGPTI